MIFLKCVNENMVIFETLVKKNLEKPKRKKTSRKAKEQKAGLCVIPLQKPVMTRRLDKDRNPPCAADMHMSDLLSNRIAIK